MRYSQHVEEAIENRMKEIVSAMLTLNFDNDESVRDGEGSVLMRESKIDLKLTNSTISENL